MIAYSYEVLERLIGFNTVSANSDVETIAYLAAEMERHGFKVSIHRVTLSGVPQANLVAWAGPPRPDGLIISGHIDTVPFEGQPGWERDPLKMEIEDGRIYGRGTSDMKGFIAQCLDAAARLELKSLKRPLVFVFTANEEVGCLGAEAVAPALSKILGDTPAPKLAWIGEPTSYEVLFAHKSIVLFDIHVHGKGGHSGAPEQGVNAIAVAAKVIDAIGRVQAERRTVRSAEFAAIFPDAPYDVLNFGTIGGGIASNVIAERCTMTLTYRSLPNRDPLELFHEIKRRVAGIDARDYGSPDHRAAIEFGEPMVVPPLKSPRGTALEKALFEATGTEKAGGALFGTDGGWFAKSGIVSLICGPGDFSQAHQPNEHIRRELFERGPEMILKVVARMCG
jgi:acetylornithine deacetylase